jgi:FkbM family methyltransferase
MRPIGSPTDLRAFYKAVRAVNGPGELDFEAIVQRVYERILEPGDTAIDAGACVGRHTFPMAARVAPSGAVHAVEPLPKLAWRLRAKLWLRYPRLIPVVKVRQLALSERNGTAEFLEAADPAYSGLTARIYPRPDMRIRKRVVRVGTLDRLWPAAPVKFIKLDIEGGEFAAMRGGAGLIANSRPMIAFEYDRWNTPQFNGFDHADLLDFLDSVEYQVVDVLGVPFHDRSLWEEAALWYYFALPRERQWHAMVVEGVRSVINLP